MELYRLQGRYEPEHGPWNLDDTLPPVGATDFDFEFQFQSLQPASIADAVAKAQHTKAPSEMPAPQAETHDFGIRIEMMIGGWHAAFRNLRQYHQWFRTKEIRTAVFMNEVIDLVKLTVPDDKVRVLKHQVLFKMEDVIKTEIIPNGPVV